MQFCVITYDGTDAEAPARRNAARPAHRAGAAALEQEGHLICGGGILNEEGESIGSIMMMNFDTQEEFDAYMESEPFLTMGVWKKVLPHHRGPAPAQEMSERRRREPLSGGVSAKKHRPSQRTVLFSFSQSTAHQPPSTMTQVPVT